MPVMEEPVSVSLDKILLATDFSAASERAASYARALARHFSSTVEIAHVFDSSVVSSYEEAITRMLSRFKREKLIQMHGASILILSPEKLEQISA